MAPAKQPDYYLVEDPESRCKVWIEPVRFVADLEHTYVLVSVDDGPKTPRRLEHLLAEISRSGSFPDWIRPDERLKFLAFELLRRHVLSDSHADMSFVELAAR